MKTKIFLFLLGYFLFLTGSVNAQTDTLALWNFEDAVKRATVTDSASFMNNPYTADYGISANVDIAPIKVIGARFPPTNNWVSGSGGTGTFAPNTDRWVNGSSPLAPKYWMITISTAGFENLKLSSKQRTSATGPRDFKVQYSTDNAVWTDVPGSAITCATDFTSGVLNNLDLPSACNNQPILHLRWIMSSDIAVNTSPVATAGTNRMDDIVITGTQGTFSNNAALSPVSFVFNIDQPAALSSTITWNDATLITSIQNNNIPPAILVNGTDYQIIADTLRILVPYLNALFTSAGQQHLLQVAFDSGLPSTIIITWDDDNLLSAIISPTSATYDLTNPGSVSTSITWNDASSISQIVDNQLTPYTLQAGDFSLAGNTLTISQAYLSGVLTSSGQTINLTINFDQGNDALFSIQSIMSPPAPIVIAEWNFENTNKRDLITDNATFISTPYTADNGTASNIDISQISLIGGNTFTTWVGGSGGTGTFAPNSTAWNDGMNTKYWQIQISTENYGDLTLSSKQRSSAGGPANFAIEYSVNGTDWYIVPGSDITCAENFTAGVLNNIPLPVACNNRTSLFLRWNMTTNTAVNASPVTTTGTNRIDDIFVRGQFITDEADLLDFSFAEQTGPATIDPVAQTIDIEVLFGTDLTTLVASFVLSPNATAVIGTTPQISGTTSNDFSSDVEYIVTAGNGITTKTWTVSVSFAPPGTDAEILDFSYVGYDTHMLDINNSTSTVNIDILSFTFVDLIAEFELSSGASADIGGIDQISGVTTNTGNQFIYTITAQDGITQRDWTVNVTLVQNISNVDKQDIINLYPNPSDGNFTLSLQESGILKVYDLTGKMILQTYVLSGNNSISIDNASSGLYMITVTRENSTRMIPVIIE